MESSRTSLASRTQFAVFGLGLEGQILALEGCKSSKIPCARLEDSTIFWLVENGPRYEQILFRLGERQRAREKNFKDILFWRTLEWRSLSRDDLGPWAFLSFASRGSVLGRAVLGLGPFFCVLGLCLEPCVLDFTSKYYLSESNPRFLNCVIKQFVCSQT